MKGLMIDNMTNRRKIVHKGQVQCDTGSEV